LITAAGACFLPVEPSFIGHHQDRSWATSDGQDFPKGREHRGVVEAVRSQDNVERVIRCC